MSPEPSVAGLPSHLLEVEPPRMGERVHVVGPSATVLREQVGEELLLVLLLVDRHAVHGRLRVGHLDHRVEEDAAAEAGLLEPRGEHVEHVQRVPAERPDARTLGAPRGAIEFRDVRFRYPRAEQVTVASLEAPSALGGSDPDRDVLQGVALVIEPGETVALVGA